MEYVENADFVQLRRVAGELHDDHRRRCRRAQGYGLGYLKLDVSPVRQKLPQVEDLINVNYALGGLATVLEYDSRDTIFSPTRGMYGKLVARTYADWLGSDDEFMACGGKVFKYLHLSDDFDFVLRVER